MIDTTTDPPAIDLPEDYTVQELLHVGGHTVLCRATRGRAAEPVAVEMLKRPGTGLEAAIRVALDAVPAHRHLVRVVETGLTPSARLFAATTYCPAGSLQDAIHRLGRVDPYDAVAMVASAADGLQAAHRRGLPHGDLRPAALLVDPAGEPVVSGFGFGALYRPDRRDAVRLAHWAPGPLDGEVATPADDVYGLAATLLTIVNGAPALIAPARDGLAALLAAALRGRAPDIPADAPVGLRDVLGAALSPDRANRPASAAEFAEALRAVGRSTMRDALGTPLPLGSAAPGLPDLAPAAPTATETAAAVEMPGHSGVPAQNAPEHSWQVPVPATADERPGPAAADGDLAGPGARAGLGGYRYVLAVAGVALAVVAAVTMTRLGAARPTAAPHARATSVSPRVTRSAPPVTRLEETAYQPQHLTAQPGPGDIVLTWVLPAGARSDGAGIIIRESPPISGDGTVALSRQGGLPLTYIAAPATAGQQVCFTVGVLVERSDGTVQLIQAGPVCAAPR